MSYIYLIECIRDYDTVYKIGYTNNNPNRRLKQLNTGNDGEMKIINVFETEWGQMVERTLHKVYSHKNINKEWFKLDIKDIVNFTPTCQKIEENIKVIKNTEKNIDI